MVAAEKDLPSRQDRCSLCTSCAYASWW